MDILTKVGVSVVAGFISIMAFYYSFSKKAEEFYEESNEDTTGYLVMVGWIVMGLHKLYKFIFGDKHIAALRITLFIFGFVFMALGIGIWFFV